eukprot:2490594-Prymnesium_polylepis.1
MLDLGAWALCSGGGACNEERGRDAHLDRRSSSRVSVRYVYVCACVCVRVPLMPCRVWRAQECALPSSGRWGCVGLSLLSGVWVWVWRSAECPVAALDGNPKDACGAMLLSTVTTLVCTY